MVRKPTLMEKKQTYYSDYLNLDSILNSQHPVTEPTEKDTHHEMLFIIGHQAHELWFKQILIELNGSIELLSAPYFNEQKLFSLSRRLHRIHVIQKILIEQLNALSTLSPMEFLEFRNALAPASGFQSIQFRTMEILLGSNKPQVIHNLNEKDQNDIAQALKQGSLFNSLNNWLERSPFLETKKFTFWREYRSQIELMLQEDAKQIHSNAYFTEEEKKQRWDELDNLKAHFELFFKQNSYEQLLLEKKRRMSFKASQSALFIFLYREQAALQLPFQILSTLIQIDENLITWKEKHLLLVKRIIGFKPGTGGSSGSNYLSQTADLSIFQDLSSLSSFMLPKSMTPKLPNELKIKLSSFYEASLMNKNMS